MIDKTKIQRILVLRYRFIGDTVLTIPFVQNVKNHFPNATIDVLVSPNSGELLEGNPHINRPIYLDTSKFHKYETPVLNSQFSILHSPFPIYTSLFSCATALKKENYDIAFVLKRSFSSALLAYLSGAKYRIGFNTELRGFLLTHRIKYDSNLHELNNFLNCLKPLDIKPEQYIPEIFCTEKERTKVQEYLSNLDKFKPKILIHATSAHPYKRWPKRYFAKLIDLLYKEINAQFVFTGADIDRDTYDSILELCENKEKIKSLNLCGLLTLRECYALYKELSLAICVDSGNAHLAACTNIPTYVLYGPTRPERWLPIGKNVFSIRLNQLLPCQHCDVKVECSHLSCMKLLTPEFVFNRLKEPTKVLNH